MTGLQRVARVADVTANPHHGDMSKKPNWAGLYQLALITVIFAGLVVAGHRAAPQLADFFRGVAGMSIAAGR